MYPSNVEYLIPENIVQNLGIFFKNFILSFSSENSANNAIILEQIESDPNTFYYLIEMIKEIIIDGNVNYQQFLITATGYLNHLVERKIKFLKNDTNLEECLLSSILYLLPYTALLFQTQNLFDCFNHLYSCFLSMMICDQAQLSIFLNPYITFLLSHQYSTQHNKIIAMYFSKNAELTPENQALLSQNITFYLQKLSDCDVSDGVTRLIYHSIFIELELFLIIYINNGVIPIDLVTQAFYQFFLKFINNYCPQNPNPDISNFQYYLKILQEILTFVYQFFYFNSRTNDENKTNKYKIYILIYQQALDLLFSSQFICSRLIFKIIEYNFQLDQINSSQMDIDYFVNLIFHLLTLTKDEIDEIVESEEHFFYDCYDNNAQTYKIFTTRQNIIRFFIEMQKNVGDELLITPFLSFLLEIEDQKLNEQHFYLLSILNIVINQLSIKNERILSLLHNLTVRFLKIGSVIVTNLVSSNFCFNNLQSVIFILTFYFLMNSSFYILGDEEVIQFNDEMNRLILIINNLKGNFSSIFFTFLCIIVDNLVDRKLLTILPGQIFQYLGENSNLCFTNHILILMNKFAVETQNTADLLKSFDIYMYHCEMMMNEFNDNDENRPVVDIPLSVLYGKDYNYSMRYFSENLQQMTKIIRFFDYSQFNENKIKAFAVSLILFGDEWLFVNESIDFISAIISKAPNAKDWVSLYIEKVKISERDEIYGDWVVPIIYIFSEQPQLIDQEFCNFILLYLKEYCESIYYLKLEPNIRRRPLMATWDAIMLLTLVSRIFEFGVLDYVNILPEYIDYFNNFIEDSRPTEEDFQKSNDYLPKDFDLAANIVKLAGILAAPQIYKDTIVPSLQYLNETGQIVCDEMRYMIIILIDRVIDPDIREQFFELRKLCLTNQIMKNKTFIDIYTADGQYFFTNERHPILNIYKIDDFIFDE